MKTMNTPEEMMAVVKKNYQIQVAAIKVYESELRRKEAQAARDTVTYDFTRKDKEMNERFFAISDAWDKAEKDVKKAVKNFFILCGKELPKGWRTMFGFEAYRYFRDYVREFSLYHITESPVVDFSILKTC